MTLQIFQNTTPEKLTKQKLLQKAYFRIRNIALTFFRSFSPQICATIVSNDHHVVRGTSVAETTLKAERSVDDFDQSRSLLQLFKTRRDPWLALAQHIKNKATIHQKGENKRQKTHNFRS